MASIALSLLCIPIVSGCGVKRTIKTTVPQKILMAKTASLDELLRIIQSYDQIRSLSCSLDVTYFSGKKESGVIQEIRKQPGFVLLKRPNSTHLVVQNFVTKTRELELLSVGDELSVWIRRDNVVYKGRNSAKELIAENTPESSEFKVPIRGAHIFEAIFPQGVPIDAPGTLHSLEEEKDSEAAYYVICYYREGAARRIYTQRRIWIERSSLTIARQQVYLDEGPLVSDIRYSEQTQVGGFPLPLKMHIDRPLDGYALDLVYKSWRIDPDLPDNAFVLTPPEGVQVKNLKEK